MNSKKKSAEGKAQPALQKIRAKMKWLDPFTYVDKFLMPRVNPGNNEYIGIIVYLVSAFFFAWLFYTVLGIAFGTPSPMVIVMSGSMEPLYQRGDVIVLFGTDAQGIQAKEAQLENPTLKETPLYLIADPEYQSTANGIQIKSIKFKNGTELQIEKTGGIIVYYSKLTQQPIIHRAVAKIHAGDGYYFLTKGDSIFNSTIDQDCGKVLYRDTARLIPYGTEKPCITLYPVPLSEIQGKAVFQIPFVGCAKLWLFDDLLSLFGSGKLPADFKGIC